MALKQRRRKVRKEKSDSRSIYSLYLLVHQYSTFCSIHSLYSLAKCFFYPSLNHICISRTPFFFSLLTHPRFFYFIYELSIVFICTDCVPTYVVLFMHYSLS